MDNSIAPVVLFTYKRLDTLIHTVQCLRNNYLASQTDLFIFCDGSKNTTDNDKVRAVQNFCDQIEGFKSVTVFKSPINKGLANSVKQGVSEILKTHGQAIVLEDDLETTPNFLDYMNQALDVYKNVPQVFSISGYTFPLERKGLKQDVFFHPRGSSWGWATWADRWNTVNWQILQTVSISDMIKARDMGSDWVPLIKKVKAQTNDSWAIPWIVNQCLQGSFTVYPTSSKISNIGFGPEATHTQKSNHRFLTTLDEGTQRKFRMEQKVTRHPGLIRQFNHRLSYWYRAYSLLHFYSTQLWSKIVSKPETVVPQ
ncbi:glycosyltransferase [Cnuella takakiae]|nr:glycosyltransferase [Cnuella takakiae]OLY94875.1 hypothetical protein BUE76_15455 [Cnuella takakiae]